MRPKGSAEVLAARRRRALGLLDQGLSLNEVARRVACQASSVMRWRDARSRVGEKVYEVGASPGRPPKLSLKQKNRLVRMIERGPLACGYTTDLWTCDRVRRLIWREFRVRYHRDHVGRLLHQLGFSPQKPERRALERDEERIARWIRNEWPRLKKRPRAGGRTSSSSTSRASS